MNFFGPHASPELDAEVFVTPVCHFHLKAFYKFAYDHNFKIQLTISLHYAAQKQTPSIHCEKYEEGDLKDENF